MEHRVTAGVQGMTEGSAKNCRLSWIKDLDLKQSLCFPV